MQEVQVLEEEIVSSGMQSPDKKGPRASDVGECGGAAAGAECTPNPITPPPPPPFPQNSNQYIKVPAFSVKEREAKESGLIYGFEEM